jgi:hypothetical protein
VIDARGLTRCVGRKRAVDSVGSGRRVDPKRLSLGERIQAGELGFEPSFPPSRPHRRDTGLMLQNNDLYAAVPFVPPPTIAPYVAMQIMWP